MNKKLGLAGAISPKGYKFRLSRKAAQLSFIIFLAGLGGYLALTTKNTSKPAVAPDAVVELGQGESYELAAGFVEKEIQGGKYRMLAYNGSIPGPLIRVKQGAEVILNFRNNADLSSTVHSHGVRLDNAFDGVPGLTQEPVAPGGSFAYRVKFPDPGMYWYHPHLREDYAQEMGLYGNYLVVPADPDYWAPVNREIALFLDDILLTDGKLELSRTKVDHALMGRFGNVMLINGKTDYLLAARQGEVIRLYLTNAANARPFNFAIAGLALKLVGGDGGGYERDEWRDTVLVGPSERVIVEVFFAQPGIFALENITPGKTIRLGAVSVAAAPVPPARAKDFTRLKARPAVSRSMDPLRPYLAKSPDKRLRLSLELKGGMAAMPGMAQGGHVMPDGTSMGHTMGPSPDGIEWEDPDPEMNRGSSPESVLWKIIDEETGKENMAIDWRLKRGEPVVIRIFNDPASAHPMQHPIHFHGQRFLVAARDGMPEANLVWKDTVLVPTGRTVDIVLDTTNPGVWMAHCHISEHLEASMMFGFRVD